MYMCTRILYISYLKIIYVYTYNISYLYIIYAIYMCVCVCMGYSFFSSPDQPIYNSNDNNDLSPQLLSLYCIRLCWKIHKP